MRRLVAALAIAAVAAPTPAHAVVDTTPPVGSISVVHDDRDAALIRLSVVATDDLSGVATVEVSGDGVTWSSFSYAASVDWAVFDPAAGGDPELGDRTIRVRWTDFAGNISAPMTTRLYMSTSMAMELPRAPITGQPFTLRPVYPPGAAIPADWDCGWELRWGDAWSLRDNKPNMTFGSLFTSGKPDRGFCDHWTFTLPDVPVDQFEAYFNGPFGSVGDVDWPDRLRLYPAAGSTDRRIRSSNLPLVHVLPDKDVMIVGEPFTYRAYPLGTTLKSTDTWAVYRPGDPIGPRYKLQYGGASFTFTPDGPGNWFVTWNGPAGRPFALNATYDPKARYRDAYRPETRPPVQRIGGGSAGPTIPVEVSWDGSDVGWGIKAFQLQRSVNGGAWLTVALPSPKAESIVQHLARDTAYRYRVRATDWYGNVGYWDYGPTFKPGIVGDHMPSVTFTAGWTVEADPEALGGTLHTAAGAGQSATLSFVGRDIAWITEKGPGLGSAKVYVDGTLVATISLAASGDYPHVVVFRRHWSTAGAHVIRVLVVGPPVGVDGFAILR